MDNYENTNQTEMDSVESVQKTKASEKCEERKNSFAEGQEAYSKCESFQKEKKLCNKCGAEVTEDQEFCSKCGWKVGIKNDVDAENKMESPNVKAVNKKSKKKFVPIIVAIFIIAIITVAVVLKGPSVESITLTKSSIEMDVEDSQKVTYTISPEKASDVEVIWTSSNSSVADVDEDGEIIAKSEGACTITAKAGKQSTSVFVVVTDKINFMKQYGQYKDEDWCEIADDGSWMKLDSNPTNADSDDIWIYYEAYSAVHDMIEVVNADLGFKSSVIEKMKSTTALQGRQSESNDDYVVSWTYHPDNGLEIMYEVK